MIKRKTKRTDGELSRLNEPATPSGADSVSELLQSRKPKQIDTLPGDDLIVSLSDAYENKRARQVFEWESVRRQNQQRAA